MIMLIRAANEKPTYVFEFMRSMGRLIRQRVLGLVEPLYTEITLHHARHRQDKTELHDDIGPLYQPTDYTVFWRHVCCLVTVIYMIADFFEKVDNLIESGLSFPKAALYFLSRIPLEHLIPASTLLSVMVVFGLMNKHNEIIALKAGGISIYRLLKAPFFLGVLFSLVLIMFSEILLADRPVQCQSHLVGGG